jgi:hypothetical protein
MQWQERAEPQKNVIAELVSCGLDFTYWLKENRTISEK